MTLSFDEVMSALEEKGTEQTRETYRRHGAQDPLFGVRFGDLRRLAKELGKDQPLATRLWHSGNADARLLACMVADPAQLSEADLDAWLATVDSYFLVDTLVAELAVAVPGRPARAERWIASERDRTAQAGWDLMSSIALNDADIPDDYFLEQLDLISRRMTDYGNWTRRSASNAITAIGLRGEVLERAARATAAGLGKVEFDPGQTACVMPDPIAYLEKTKAHRARQAARRASPST